VIVVDASTLVKEVYSNMRRVATFRGRAIEMITMRTPLYSIGVKYVDPRGTTNSKEHNEAMKRFGLDRRTASAYLIARRLLAAI